MAAVKLAAVALLAVCLAASQAAARPGPCGGALLISYSSISSSEGITVDGEPGGFRRPATFVAVFRIVGLRHRRSRLHSFPADPIRRIQPAVESDGITASIQERARDIMVVVAGLLFGVGCGVLTAATVYLVYSIVANRHLLFGSEEGYYVDEDEDDIETIKKAGYIKIADDEKPKEEAAVADAKN